MKSLHILSISVLIWACNSSTNSHQNPESLKWEKDSLEMIKLYAPSKMADKLLDTLMPYFAKTHDSIPFDDRFNAKYKSYYDAQKNDRQYNALYYGKGNDSFYYLMVTRLEPSIKNNKYASVCCKFKRLSDGSIDTASYEELFWTWKMLIGDLRKKSALLFKKAVNQERLNDYMPAEGREDYLMFPDEHTVYDKRSKTWKSQGTL